MKHIIKELRNRQDEYKWAVMWFDKIVCLTINKEYADQIAWALDTALPYDGNRLK
jgi:hypothetical protein